MWKITAFVLLQRVRLTIVIYLLLIILKPLLETERSSLEAKVPSVKRRTSCVYADLRNLYLEMDILKAA